MEYIDGPSLDEMIEQARKDSLQRRARSGSSSSRGSSTADPAYIAHAVEQVAALAEGVEEAHRLGLIHRDVKPSNILVDSAGRYVLVDFGLVREEEAHTLTRSGEMVGTLAYMSPEQVSRRRVDSRCDVYGLGVTLYEVLTLESPFPGESDVEIQNAILFRDPVSPRKLNPRLNRDLETIILHSIEKDPDRRYSTASELATDLKRFLRYEPIRARPQPALTRLTRRLWRHRAAAVFLSLLVALLVVVAIVLAENARVRRQEARRAYETEVPALAKELQRHRMSRMESWGLLLSTDVQAIGEALVADARPELERIVAALGHSARSVEERPEASFYQARGLLLLGREEDALERLEEALDRDPKFLPALLLKASLLEKRGEPDAVRRVFEKAAELTDEAWARAWLRGRSAFRDHRWDDAVGALDEVDRLDRDGREPYPGARFENHLLRGLARLEVQNFRGAEQDFIAAKALERQALEPELLRGKAYYLQGKTGDADALFRHLYAEAEASQKDEVALAVGAMYVALRNPLKGLEWADAVSEPYSRARTQALFHYVRGNWAAAIRACRKTLENQPEDVYILSGLSWSLYFAGKTEDALVACRRGLAIAPDHEFLRWALHHCLSRLKRFDEAIAEFSQYAREHRNSAAAYNDLGRCYAAKGEFQQAVKWYKKGLEVEETVRGLSHLGDAFMRLGELDDAREYLGKAVIDFRSAEPYYPLAQLHLRAGEFRKAVRCYVQAIDLRPDFSVPFVPLRQALESHGDSVPPEDIQSHARILKAIVDAKRLHEPENVLKTLMAILIRLPRTEEREVKILEYARYLIKAERTADDVPETAGILAAYYYSRGNRKAAIQTLERALREPWRARLFERQLEKYREHPDCASFASIDAALVRGNREEFVPEGAVWKYRKGVEEPPPDWTALEFNDDAWESGPSGFGYGDHDDATEFEDMPGRYTTIYVRHTFTVPDHRRYVRLRLSVRVDDGYVAYLNGTEIRRLHVVPTGRPVPHDSLATDGVGEAIDDSILLRRDLLREGDNVLAVQVLNSSPSSTDLTLIPVLEAELPRDAARDQAILDEFRAARAGDDAEVRIAYFGGRLLQRGGRYAEAAEKFRQVVATKTSFPEPYLRLAECLREAGNVPEAEKILRDALQGRLGDSREVWNAWVDASTRGLDRTPAEILKDFPEGPSEYGEDVRWLLEELRDRRAVRINSGDGDYKSAEGVLWGRDRFFSGRHPSPAGAVSFEENIENSVDDPLYQVQRSWTAEEASPHGYRIPLPPGRYRVTLHFAEIERDAHSRQRGKRNFDVLLEGDAKLEGYELPKGFATADARSDDVSVDDALLEIDFVRRVNHPIVSAVEIQAVGDE